MPLAPGDRLGPYEIVAPLGAGGMGEVYRARDSKLGRDVAVKVLPEGLAADADYMARFDREAQTLASLNHPNIAAIYGVEANAIVMELVEGETLADRIERGALGPAEALPLALQIAEALEAAHEKGVIHRDLKPANVKVTPDGVAKVLDFGLAKSTDKANAATAIGSSPTLTIRATQAGLIMGTAGYMAPEQAAGKPVDRRADIWSFGVVLVEMLTGRQLFEGETVSHTLAHVLTAEIDFKRLPAETPASIRALALRCLDRNPKTRLRDMGEARITIQKAIANPTEPQAAIPVQPPSRRSPLPLVAALVVALAIAGAGWWRATRPGSLRPLQRLNVEIASDMPLINFGSGGELALSPDGQRLVVTLRGADGKIQLHTRLLHQKALTPLAGTENGNSPFLSPDGQWIGFTADGKLKKIAVEGGAAVIICEAANLRGASWGDDGNIVFARSATGALWRVSSAGGAPAQLTKLKDGERTHRWPQVLPGSQVVLFTEHNASSKFDDANIEALTIKTGERRTVQHGGFSPQYVATGNGVGRLFYLHQATLFTAPFDVGRMALAGAAAPVLEQVSSSGNGGADFAISPDGTLVYLSGPANQGLWKIAWVEPSGKRQPLHDVLGSYFTPRFSPDGKRLAVSLANSNGSDLWVKDLDRDSPSRLTFVEGSNHWPVWMPDGKHIVFKSQNQGAPGLYWVRSDGAGEPIRLTDGKLDEIPYSISPDGKRLAFAAGDRAGSRVFTAPIEGDSGHPALGKRELFAGGPTSEFHPAFSPDGRWLAYTSTESGTAEIFVRPFPGPGGRWQISTGGGTYPVWSRDGRNLLFRGVDQRVWAATYTARADTFVAEKQRVWVDLQMMTFGSLATWDLAPDGKRLAACMPDVDEKVAPPTHLTFLLNFLDELQRRAPL